MERERKPAKRRIATEAHEDVDDFLRNHRAGTAVVSEVSISEKGEVGVPVTVAVEFDFPYGDWSFEQEFGVTDTNRSLNDVCQLYRHVGLVPGVNSIQELKGQEVPVALTDGEWSVDLGDDVSTTDEFVNSENDRVTIGGRALLFISVVLMMFGLFSVAVAPYGLYLHLFGGGIPGGLVAVCIAPLFSALTTATYVGVGVTTHPESKYPHGLQRLINTLEESSFLEATFHLATVGIFV